MLRNKRNAVPMTLRDDQVIEVFRELPGHRGCTAANLDAFERETGVQLPLKYRDMMHLDEWRLASAGIVAPLRRLRDLRQDATDVLVEDDHSFRLASNDVVFAWEDTFAFYFFRADGTADPPVMMFNYYNADAGWAATTAYDRLTDYFTDALRRYLKLT